MKNENEISFNIKLYSCICNGTNANALPAYAGQVY